MGTSLIRTLILPLVFYTYLLLLLLPAPPQTSAAAVNKKSRVMLNIISVRNSTRNKDSLPNHLKNVVITQQDRDRVVVNLNILIVRIPKSKIQVLIEIYQCTDRSATQCEYFMKVPMAVCELFAKNRFWSPIYDTIEPPIDCHNIKPGEYKMTNATVDMAQLMDMMSKFPNLKAFDFYWKLEGAIVTNKKDVFCGQYVVKFDTIKINPT